MQNGPKLVKVPALVRLQYKSLQTMLKFLRFEGFNVWSITHIIFYNNSSGTLG